MAGCQVGFSVHTELIGSNQLVTKIIKIQDQEIVKPKMTYTVWPREQEDRAI